MRRVLFACLLLLLAAPVWAAGVVPETGLVSDAEARLSLARLLGEEGMDEEALAQARLARAAGESGPVLDVLEARALVRLGRTAEAAPLIARLAKSAHTPGELADLADLELGLGHAVRGRDLYERALAATPDEPQRREMRLRYASRMSAWGAFDRGAAMLREELGRIPEKRQDVLILAGLLDGGQRRQEARALFARLLVLDPDDAEARLALAGSLLDSGEYDRAREILAPLAGDERAAPLLKRAETRRFVAEAAPASASATSSGKPTPAGLLADGKSLLAEGRAAEAEKRFAEALALDPENFAARLALAESLAAQSRLAEAVTVCDDILARLPDSSRAALDRARYLGWSERYDDSVAAYRALIEAAPDNGTARRELARTLYWAKRGDEADAVYATLWHPSVDEKLAEALAARGQPLPQAAAASPESLEPYVAYARYAPAAPKDDALLLADLSGDFELQRAAWIERDMKRLGYETRYTRAVAEADALLAVEPGNEEARFDRAQALCSLGLVGEEKEAYAELVALDPAHSLAAEALRRARVRSAPLLETRASIWHEDGRGELSKMIRLASEVRYTYSLSDRIAVFAAQGVWGEIPTRHGGDATAQGQTLGARIAFTDWLRGGGEWTYKFYDREDYGSYGLGNAYLAADVAGLATVTVSWKKQEEFTNAFGLKGRTMSNRLEGRVFSQLTRDLEAEFTAENINYNDANEGWRQRLMAAYRLTDHPDELKLVVAGEHRDTEHKSVFLTGPDGSTTGIIHPYWTPTNYYEIETGLRWRQDLAERQFCGGLERYWGLGAYTGTDTDKNPFFKLEAEARWEFTEAWTFWAKGLFHRSAQWDAEGGWMGLEYRFGAGDGR